MLEGDDKPALVAICGTPSPLTHWAALYVNALATAAWGAHAFVGANSDEEFLDALDRSTGGPFILLAHVPTRALMDRIVQTFDHVLLIEDAPADVIGFVRTERGVPLWEAITVTSQALTTLAYLRVKLKPPELRGDFYATEIGAATKAICEKLEMNAPNAWTASPSLTSDSAAATTVLTRILAEIRYARPPGQYFIDSSATECDLVNTACRHFDNLALGRPLARSQWPIPLFMTSDKKGQPLWANLREAIDLTGPARTLIYGPYLHLPVGAWYLRGTLQVEDNHSRNVVQMDVTAGERTLAMVKAPLPVEGEFAFEMTFEVDEPRDPMQLRVHILEGAIEGALRLGAIEILPK